MFEGSTLNLALKSLLIIAERMQEGLPAVGKGPEGTQHIPSDTFHEGTSLCKFYWSLSNSEKIQAFGFVSPSSHFLWLGLGMKLLPESYAVTDSQSKCSMVANGKTKVVIIPGTSAKLLHA